MVNSMPLLDANATNMELRSFDLDQRQRPSNSDSFIDSDDEKPRRPKKRTTMIRNIKSRKRAIWQSLIHVFAAGITLGVCSMTFRSIFWTGPKEEMNTYLNLLQFAAQAHATLIVTSLSAMLLHFVHKGLSSKLGTPLGFLSSSFQLNSVTYLFRREFTTLPVKYIMMFLFTFILALLSNPSSAIVILPRLQYWPLQNSWMGKGDMDFRVYVAAPYDRIYPEQLNEDMLPVQCFTGNASLDDACPSFGMRHWLMTLDPFSANTSNTGVPPTNQTIQSNWIRYMIGLQGQFNRNIQTSHYASTLSNFLGDILTRFDNFLDDFGQYGNQIMGTSQLTTLQKEVKENLGLRYDLHLGSPDEGKVTRKPMVSVECAGHPADAENLPLLHDTLYWPPWNSEPIKSAKWTVQASSFLNAARDLNSSTVNASIIDIERFGDIKPSLGVFFSTPEIRVPGNGRCFNCGDANPNRNHSMFTCTIDARWIPARPFSDSSYGLRTIFDSEPNPLGDALNEYSKTKSSPSVFLSSSWAKALTVPWVNDILNPTPSNRTMLDIIGQQCLDANTRLNATLLGRRFEDGLSHRVNTEPINMLQCLQVSLSISIAEALSRNQDNIPAYFIAEGHNLPVNTKRKHFKPDVFLVADLRRSTPQQHPDTSKGWIGNMSKADFADNSRFTEVKMPIARWGYGYGFHDSILIYVGIILLLIHAAAALVYIVWIIARGEYEDAGWDSIGGLVNMAMRSGTKEEASAVDEPPSGSRKERNIFWRNKWRGRVAVRQARRGEDDSSTSGMLLERGTSERGRTVLVRIENIEMVKDLESNERSRQLSSDDRSARTATE